MQRNLANLAVALVAGTFAFTAGAQDKGAAKPKAATPASSTSTRVVVNGVTIPPSRFDAMNKELSAQGQPDNPERQQAVKEELVNREVLAQAAAKRGLDKSADVAAQMDMARQAVLVRALFESEVKAHPITDDMLRVQYEQFKASMGTNEYKVRHILVEKEDEAKEIIAELQKGTKFEKLAERSKDTGSKATGGDLDWNAPGNFVKPFSEAMVKLPKGKFTATPVQSQFGWHVIEVTDIRDAKVPSFEEVKPQLQQRMQGQYLDTYFKELRAKNGL